MRAATLGIVWGLLVTLMLAAAACDDSPQSAATPKPTPPFVPTSTHPPTSPFIAEATRSPTAAPTPLEPVAQKALANALRDPMARIAERVPGFGGVFLDTSEDIVYIYLQDASLKEEAERALTEEFGSDFLAGREVRVLEGDYSMVYLDAWHKALSDVMMLSGRFPASLGATWTKGPTVLKSACTRSVGRVRRWRPQ